MCWCYILATTKPVLLPWISIRFLDWPHTLYLVPLNWICDFCIWWKRTCEDKGYIVAELQKRSGILCRPEYPAPKRSEVPSTTCQGFQEVLAGRKSGRKFMAGTILHLGPSSAEIHIDHLGRKFTRNLLARCELHSARPSPA